MARKIGEKTTVYVQRITVRCFPGSVPFDMMRYDACVPDTGEDASKLEALANGPRSRETGPRDVVFRRYSLNGDMPETRRWESFGCQIIEVRNS